MSQNEMSNFRLTSGILIAMLAVSSLAQATDRGPAAIPSNQQISPELIEAYQQSKQFEQARDYSSYAPTNINPGSTADEALAKAADRSVQAWWNTPEVQESAAGKVVNKAESHLNQSAVFEDEKNVKHEVNLKVLAFQTKAAIRYTGFMTASLFVMARESKVGVEIADFFFQDKLILSHEVSPADTISRMSLRFDF